MTPIKKNIELNIRYKAMDKIGTIYSVATLDVPYIPIYKAVNNKVKSDTHLWFLYQRLKYT